jgi:hypothetical protein
MGYVLLWIESLAVSLLFVATMVACLAQLGPRQSRWFARGLALLIACMGAMAVVGLSENTWMSTPFLWLWIALLFVATLVACLAQLGPRQSRWFARGLALLIACIGAMAEVGLSKNIWMSTPFLWLWIALLFVVTLVACLAQLGPRQSRWFAQGLALLIACMGAMAVVGLPENIWMSTPFLWIAVTIVCTVGAIWALLRGPWRSAAAILVALAPLAIDAASASFAAVLHFRNMASGILFSALVMLTVAYGLGAVGVLVYGLRRQPEAAPVRAGTWPRGRLAVALLVAVALHLMTFWNMDLAARQQLAALRTEAGALALSVAPPRLPDRDNAAVVYHQAFEAMGDPFGGQWEKPWQDAWYAQWTNWQVAEKIGFDPHDPELRRFLKRQSSALALVRQAAAKPGCTFDRDYGRPSFSMRLPEISPLDTAAHVLALDAICRADDKDYRGAIEDVIAMFCIAEHIGADPVLVSQGHSTRVEALTINTLRHLLSSGRVPPENLATIHVPDGMSYRTQLRRAFRMEEAFGLATFEHVGDGRVGLAEFTEIYDRTLFSFHPSNLPILIPLYRVFLLGDDLAAHARFTARLESAAGRTYDQAQAFLQQFNQDLRIDPGGVLTARLLSGSPYYVGSAAFVEARRDTARLGLALCAYRARHGRIPGTLDDLVPDFIPVVPRDPFDGKAMKFKRTGHGAVVYSIGPDMTDNGGAPFDREKQTGEITFTIP